MTRDKLHNRIRPCSPAGTQRDKYKGYLGIRLHSNSHPRIFCVPPVLGLRRHGLYEVRSLI